MRADKFELNYKCSCFEPDNICSCADKVLSVEAHIERVKAVAEALVDVMVVCGIPQYKAHMSSVVTQFHFMHFLEIRHRIDALPHKRLCRLDIFRDLSTKALMNRFETQMAYGIIKRAFRAFYFATGIGGIPNKEILQGKLHDNQCLWVKSARRIAQLHNSYVGVFPIYQLYTELSIKAIFHKLNITLKRFSKLKYDNNECTCMKCLKRIVDTQLTNKGHTKRNSDISEPKKSYLDEILERRYYRPNCNCRTFKWTKDDYKIADQAIDTNTGYGQGPFRCTWYKAPKEEIEADQKPLEANLPVEYPCPPASCEFDDKIDSECLSCECDCEYCECESLGDSEEPPLEEMGELESLFGDEELEGLTDNPPEMYNVKCGCQTPNIYICSENKIPCKKQLEEEKIPCKATKPKKKRRRKNRLADIVLMQQSTESVNTLTEKNSDIL